MSWLDTLPVLAAALAILLLPGGLTLALGGVRRLNLLALAGPVSLSFAAVFAVAFGLAGVPFTPLTFGAASVAVALAVWAIRLIRVRRRPEMRGRSLAMNGPIFRGALGRVSAWVALPVAVLGGGALVARRLTSSIGSPENFSQTFDNVFHLNAIHHIAATQNGSSLTVGNLTEASAGFYPAAMHDAFALVQMATGAPVPVVVNACVLVVAALVWPLGAIYLVTRATGARPVPVVAAGLLAAGFSAFPFLLIGFGVLYSLFMSIAVLPAALGLCVELAGLARRRTGPWITPLLWLILVVPGLMLAHPSTLIALLLFCVPLFAARTLREFFAARRGAGSWKTTGLWLGLSIAYGVFFTVAWIKVRPDLTAAPWGANQSTAQAIGEVLASAPMGAIAAWVMLFFTVIGIYAILRWQRQLWWVLAIYGLGAILHMFASGWGSGTLRTFMVGVWYNDPFRPAALLPVVTIPVVVIGVDATYRWVRWRAGLVVRAANGGSPLRGTRASVARLVLNAGTWVVIAMIAMLSQSGTLTNVTQRISQIFAMKPDADLVSTDELALLQRIGDLVPEGERIVVNPFTGASLAYALGDRATIPPHMFGDRSDDEQFLIDHWQEAAYNPAVCPIVRELGAYWALDFGTRTVIDTNDRYLGLDRLSDAPGVELVDEQGGAKLVRLTLCD